MHLAHTLLISSAAAGLWFAGHVWSCAQSSLRTPPRPAFFGVPGSPYGGLAARIMRDSLYSYWHNGESAFQSRHSHGDEGQDVAAPAGRLAVHSHSGGHGHSHDASECEDENADTESPVERLAEEISHLEGARTRTNNKRGMSAGHARFLNASASAHLRLAYELDPTDPVLYELLHFQTATGSENARAAAQALGRLTGDAMSRGKAPGSTLTAALTGASAATNSLNELLIIDRPVPATRGELLDYWQGLLECLGRYGAVRREAEAEGWWSRIPEQRRGDLDTHARLLKRIAENIRQTLHKRQLLPETDPALPNGR